MAAVNDRLDYFRQTVRLVTRLEIRLLQANCSSARPGGDLEVASLLRGRAIQLDQMQERAAAACHLRLPLKL